MKRLSILLALALVVALTLPAVAEVEEITVGGDITVRGQYLGPGRGGASPLGGIDVDGDTVFTPGTDIAIPAGTFGAVSGFNEDNNSNDWITQRTRVNVDAKLSGGVRAFVELQSFDSWGVQGDAAEDAGGTFDSVNFVSGGDLVGLYQSFIQMNDVADYPLQLTIGRQELAYGREFLVGNNDAGVNFAGLAFDGVKASYVDEMFSVDAWWSKRNDRSGPGIAAEEDGDRDFYGVYGSYTGVENVVIDAYWLWLREALSVPGSSGDTNSLHTVGARAAGCWEFDAGTLDAGIEAAFQFGDNNVGTGGDYEGMALNAMAGFSFADIAWSPRVEAEYAWLSGDDDPADNDTETFNRLFSDVHYGELNLGGDLDLLATNLHIIRVGASAVPAEKLTLEADFYLFMLEEEDGPVFGNLQPVVTGAFTAPAALAGQPIYAGTDDDDDVGMELDLAAEYQYTEDLNLRAGWAHFFVGDALENAWGQGNDDDTDYLYVQAALDF